MKAPCEDGIVREDLFQLHPTGGHYYVGGAFRRQFRAIEIGIVKKVHTVDNDALFTGRLTFEHLGSLGNTCMFLDNIITRACRYIVTIGPNGRPRIIGEIGPEKLVPVILAERIGTGTYRVTHRVRSLRSVRGRPN